MPFPWVRLDTAMPDNPKILHLLDSHKEGAAAAFVWVCSIAYCGKHGTDGFVSRSALSRINGKAIHARLLVEHGFWKDEGVGWTVHDYTEFQQSTIETQARTDRARKAAFVRWHGKVDEHDAQRNA